MTLPKVQNDPANGEATLNLLVLMRSTPAHSLSGGMEQVAWDLICELSATWSITVVTTPYSENFSQAPPDNVRIVVLPDVPSGRYSAKWWTRTARLDLARSADAVLSISAAGTALALAQRRLKYVVQAHGSARSEAAGVLALRPRLWVLKYLRLLIWMLIDTATYRRADAVVSAGPEVSAKLMVAPTRWGIAQSKLREIPNGVRVTADHVQGTRGHTTVCVVGRLVRQKGADRAIEALSRCPDHVSLVIAGSGPEEQALRRLVDKLGLEHRVSFRGHTPHHEILQIMKRCQILVFPVRQHAREGLPLVVLEAIAAGLRVVVPAGSSWPADLQDSLKQCDVANPVELANEMSCIAEGAMAKLHPRYHLDCMAQGYDQLLRQVGSTG